MKENKYKIDGKTIVKKDNSIVKYLNPLQGPTSNCQVSSFSDFNIIYLLNLEQIRQLIGNLKRNYCSYQILINLTDKRAIKKFNKYLEFYKIKCKTILESETCTSYLILKNLI